MKHLTLIIALSIALALFILLWADFTIRLWLHVHHWTQ